jgi:hypothetical protein
MPGLGNCLDTAEQKPRITRITRIAASGTCSRHIGRKCWNIEYPILNGECRRNLARPPTSSFDIPCSVFDIPALSPDVLAAKRGTVPRVVGRLSARGVAHSVKHVPRGERLINSSQAAGVSSMNPGMRCITASPDGCPSLFPLAACNDSKRFS